LNDPGIGFRPIAIRHEYVYDPTNVVVLVEVEVGGTSECVYSTVTSSVSTVDGPMGFSFVLRHSVLVFQMIIDRYKAGIKS